MALEFFGFRQGVEKPAMFSNSGRVKVIGNAADGNDQSIIGKTAAWDKFLPLLVVIRREPDEALRSIQRFQAADAKAQVMASGVSQRRASLRWGLA